MSKRQLILDEEFADFLASWQAERGKWAGGYVPGRLLLVSGLMLRELLGAGMVETNGFGFSPA